MARAMTGHYSDIYWSTADGLQIAARSWTVPRPLATVLITHGLGDHSGRFEPMCRFFNDQGFSVLVPDLRGHGRSEGQRGYVRDFDEFLDDMDISVEQAWHLQDDQPVFGWGQSFGGLLVLYHALRRQPRLGGLVASSPALKIAMPVPAWKTALGRTMGRLLPRISVRSGLDLSELSDDPRTESRARSDRYLHGRITPRTWFGMVDAGQWCLQHADQLATPALVMHGRRDTITDPVATREFAQSAPGCLLREWPDGKHELHNMARSDDYLAYVTDWIRQQVAGSPTRNV